MLAYKINIQDIKDQIFIPKYYDPTLKQELLDLQETHSLLPLGSLIDAGIIGAQTGHEIGKMAYGTGSIPFVRTSDISNWEIKTIPKQGVSQQIYQQYSCREDVQLNGTRRNVFDWHKLYRNAPRYSYDLPIAYFEIPRC